MSATTATIKWINESKGYGFIGQESDPDVFSHHSNIIGNGFKLLEKGPQAGNITSI